MRCPTGKQLQENAWEKLLDRRESRCGLATRKKKISAAQNGDLPKQVAAVKNIKLKRDENYFSSRADHFCRASLTAPSTIAYARDAEVLLFLQVVVRVTKPEPGL